ncbi:hypothetical protein, partial [Enterobacter roggenkampii]|uniref:hypothetical protein n=1 Tax=Enterobacter roggenkampii TaxID=1812935 RepID=UPI000940C808
KSAQIREILISESAWEEMTCLFAPSLTLYRPSPLFITDLINPEILMLLRALISHLFIEKSVCATVIY